MDTSQLASAASRMASSSFLESARSNAERRVASNLSITERRVEWRDCQFVNGLIWGDRKRERRCNDLDWVWDVTWVVEVEEEWVGEDGVRDRNEDSEDRMI